MRNKEANVVPKDRRVTVEKVGRELDHHRQLCQFLEELSRGYSGMVACAATNQHEASASLDLRDVILEGVTGCRLSFHQIVTDNYLDSAQSDGIVLKVEPPSHSVHHRLWLLKDLLLHEVLVIALHNLLNLHFERRDLAGVRIVHATTQPMDTQGAFFYGRDIVVLSTRHHGILALTANSLPMILRHADSHLEEYHTIRVFDHGARVGSEKILHFLIFQRLKFGCALAAGHHWQFRISTVRTMICVETNASVFCITNVRKFPLEKRIFFLYPDSCQITKPLYDVSTIH